MALDTEVGAVIGGCVGGGVVLVIFIAVIIYLFCGKRRRRKEEDREKQKFHHLTPHTSPTHSQPSTLNRGPTQPTPPPHAEPPRLPKVGSYGLWVGAPGIYAATPSPAYAYGAGRVGGRTHYLMQPAVMHRASSDTRLPSGRGPAVYSSGSSQQRIYHSQGLPSPLSPVYEFRDPSNGSVYDVYQIGGGSTTSLLRDSSSKSGKGVKRLQRSQSDVVSEPTRRAYRTSAELRASRASSNKTSSPGSISELTPRSQDDLGEKIEQIPEPGEEEKPIFIEKIVQEEKVAVVASATDSMKLLAKNKTDDQKTVDHSSASESGPSAPETRNGSSSLPTTPASPSSVSTSPLHYSSQQGDIYAVPDKEASRSRPTQHTNPTPEHGARSEEEEEEARSNERISVADITERAESLLVEDPPSFGPAPVVQNPIYQEAGEPPREYEPSLTHTSIYEEVGGVVVAAQTERDKTVSGASVGDTGQPRGVHLSASVGSSSVHAPPEVSGRQPGSEVAAASAVSAGGEVGASGETEEPPGGGGRRRALQEQSSYESDDFTRAGKHISVTAEAFQFLDTYLSDEDGADFHSPPMSPVSSDRRELL